MRGLGLLSLTLAAAAFGTADAHACPVPVADAFPRGGELPVNGSIHVWVRDVGYGLDLDTLTVRRDGRSVPFRVERLDGCGGELFRLIPETALEPGGSYAVLQSNRNEDWISKTEAGQFRAGRSVAPVPEAPEVASVRAVEDAFPSAENHAWPRIVLESPPPEVAYYAIWSVPPWGRLDYGSPPAARQYAGVPPYYRPFLDEDVDEDIESSIDLRCLSRESRVHAQRFGIRAVGYDGQMGPPTEYLWDPNDELLGVWEEPWQARPWRNRPWFWNAFGAALAVDVTILFLLGQRRSSAAPQCRPDPRASRHTS